MVYNPNGTNTGLFAPASIKPGHGKHLLTMGIVFFDGDYGRISSRPHREE
jgi:hypothetical protein